MFFVWRVFSCIVSLLALKRRDVAWHNDNLPIHRRFQFFLRLDGRALFRKSAKPTLTYFVQLTWFFVEPTINLSKCSRDQICPSLFCAYKFTDMVISEATRFSNKNLKNIKIIHRLLADFFVFTSYDLCTIVWTYLCVWILWFSNIASQQSYRLDL